MLIDIAIESGREELLYRKQRALTLVSERHERRANLARL